VLLRLQIALKHTDTDAYIIKLERYYIHININCISVAQVIVILIPVPVVVL